MITYVATTFLTLCSHMLSLQKILYLLLRKCFCSWHSPVTYQTPIIFQQDKVSGVVRLLHSKVMMDRPYSRLEKLSSSSCRLLQRMVCKFFIVIQAVLYDFRFMPRTFLYSEQLLLSTICRRSLPYSLPDNRQFWLCNYYWYNTQLPISCMILK